MKRSLRTLLPILACCLLAATAFGQSAQTGPASGVVGRSIKAIGYQSGGGGTRIDLVGNDLMPRANGEAKVESKGVTTIEVQVRGLESPTKLGAEFLTYVIWAVSPDGRANNLGEILLNNNGEGTLKATTQMQTFSLFVTAEPYFSVRQPSEMLVLENETRKDTKGKIFVVTDYKLMRRSLYEKMGNPLSLSLDLKNVPLEMYEARNAVEIAKSRGADRYATEIFNKAEGSLKMAENALARKASKKEIISTARQTVQFSEDARALAVQRQEEERIANERAAAAARAKAEAEAKAAEEAADAKLKAEQEAQRQAELAAAREAQMKAEAEAAALKARVEADALKAKEVAANAEAERSRQAADQARRAAEQARRASEQLRASLLEQFNRILETRDTERGLVVNMADVLFDTGKYQLRPPAREKLARLSGIVLSNPGLNLDVEGHTDSTGGDELNQALSEKRAESVRGYLVDQGLPESKVTAKGLGKSISIADNTTAAGRQKNRRVEIIVSGEVIGAKIGK